MDRTESTSSDASSSSKAAPFAYQTRLLERTSSLRGSLSRSNSHSSILTNPTGSSTASTTTRRWTQTHRVANSLDVVRGKWEERSREAGLEEASNRPASPTKDSPPRRMTLIDSSSATRSAPFMLTSSPDQPLSTVTLSEQYRTPTYLKRRTMPAPIIASPLSPNITGITIEADSPSSMTPNRIHLPSSDASSRHSPFTSTSRIPANPTPLSVNITSPALSQQQSLSSLDSMAWTSSSRPADRLHDLDTVRKFASGPTREPLTTLPILTPVRRRPTSVHGVPSPSSFDKSSLNSANVPHLLDKGFQSSTFAIPALSETNSVMTPSPYRSSYMSNKKASYGDSLGARRLGRHLPRIASGDGDEKWEEDIPQIQKQKENEIPSTPEKKERRILPRDVRLDSPLVFGNDKKDLAVVDVAASVDDVAGLPGRIQLKAPSAPSSPMPSIRFMGSLWADKQRHLVHAYEYLCHVGEAQQWIEGCLGEVLEFGVVEMEEGLRNGVVLAKLVRAFQGENAVKKIFESSNLRDYRHSDNINRFFDFVREVGLPENFIFELTDLYDKKNLPKVIYCIHALSHLLARRGRAERIGNLIGHLHFSDDQLQRAQKGLKESGVPMPNFTNVGRALAKDLNEEPEETEEDRHHRLLQEQEGSILIFQAAARGYLARSVHTAQQGRIRIAERYFIKLQAHLEGVLVRKSMQQRRRLHCQLGNWAVALQAATRGALVRKQWQAHLRHIRALSSLYTRFQAQARGAIQRRRCAQLTAALRRVNRSITRLQAVARARAPRQARIGLSKTFTRPRIGHSVVTLQTQLRGVIVRRQAYRQIQILRGFLPTYVALQAHCRGVVIRRRLRAQVAKIVNSTTIVIQIQAAVRTYLARKRLLTLIRGLRKATPAVVGLQTIVRARITRQHHTSLKKDLREVQTIVAVNSFQAMARAALARNRHQEIFKRLEKSEHDVTGFQAVSRGMLIRQDYLAWRGHLRRSQPVATILQAMLRGVMQRRVFHAKMEYYRANLSKVVKIQSLFRAKDMREQYRQLTLGKNVTVGTIKNFVHLLDDSEADFQDEVAVERLRKKVVEHIRENQALENDVNDLDVKIALVVHNVKSFEELMKAKRHGVDNAASYNARISLLAAYNDPFSGPNTLDHDARRKLELYQQLFYLLQTKGEYLSRLFIQLSMPNTPETSRRFVERVVLMLFGYGQDRREDFLLLKLFQLSVREEIFAASTVEDVAHGHPMYINIALHYVRPKQVTFARDAFQQIIHELINANDLDLESDPTVIHHARIELEEMMSGISSSHPKDVPFRDALKDPDTRAVYIRHLQVLQWWSEAFIKAIIQSTKKMSYGMRYLARETWIALQFKFPGVPEEGYAACIGRLVFYRYIYPILINPDAFDIIPKDISVATRKSLEKNLAQISKILTQIASGSEFDDNTPSLVPINDYVRKSISELSAWFMEVANVTDAESQFHAHEFLDVTVQPKPIYISPNEIYTIHGLLLQHQNILALDQVDTLKVILNELGSVPNLGNDELRDARDTAITLELTNRFAHVRDPLAEEKTLWVQAKRAVLAILRVHPAQDLLESLMRPVTEDDEIAWEELETEMRQVPRRQPSGVIDPAYRLEDIPEMRFAAVKALAIKTLLELEKLGKITRDDGFQGILNAIAGDVRSKHRKRLQRQQEIASMKEALRHLSERKKYFLEQIDSYNSYVEGAMATMQRGKGKKRFVLPFSKQFFHLRQLQKTGETPEYGSFRYTAKDFYERGILLSIDQYSPRQFNKIFITLSSKTAGVFNLLLESSILGVTARIGTEDIRMEDLLQAKYQKLPSLSLFGGRVRVNYEQLLFQVNKKFYA